MEGLLAEVEAAESMLGDWTASGAGDSTEISLLANLQERWMEATVSLQESLRKDTEETERLNGQWMESTTSEAYVTGASNKELQAKMRKLDHRCERAVTECAAGIAAALKAAGRERALINLSAGAATALEDERSALQSVLEKHNKSKAAVAKEWEALKKKYFGELATGVLFLEGAVQSVASSSLQEAYKEWSVEALDVHEAQQAAATKKAEIQSARAREQSEKAKEKEEQERHRREKAQRKTDQQQEQLSRAKEEGARLVKEKEEAAELARIQEEKEAAERAKAEKLRKKEEAKKKKEEARQKKEAEEEAKKAAAAAAALPAAIASRQGIPLPKPPPGLEGVALAPPAVAEVQLPSYPSTACDSHPAPTGCESDGSGLRGPSTVHSPARTRASQQQTEHRRRPAGGRQARRGYETGPEGAGCRALYPPQVRRWGPCGFLLRPFLQEQGQDPNTGSYRWPRYRTNQDPNTGPCQDPDQAPWDREGEEPWTGACPEGR